MPFYKWQRRPTKHFGDVCVPYAHVGLRRANGRYQAFALQIDSGAVVSLLRKSVGELLEIKLEAGRPVELGGVGGAKTNAFVHDIETRFADNIVLTIPFAFATTESVPNLLGRLNVFDRLQIDFDGTLELTRLATPWLDPVDRKIWDFLLQTEKHVIARWPAVQLPETAKLVTRDFLDRAGQIIASGVALLARHSCYAAPALVRTLLEMAIQFEYILRDPEPRAQRYRDFSHVTRYRTMKALVENPVGPISQRLANSPLRQGGERRNAAEYERIRTTFVRTKKGKEVLADTWSGKPLRQLAIEIGLEGEYRLIYSTCSEWTHGAPASVEQHPSAIALVESEMFFSAMFKYYARMLLAVCEAGKIMLTSEQYEALKAKSQPWS